MSSPNDEEQIRRLFEDGDRALIAADLGELSRIFADDDVQYDETGKSYSKQDVINNLKSGAIRYILMKSTGRRIRLLSRRLSTVRKRTRSNKAESASLFAISTWM
jgi:hypothetical protein